jgi:ParB-like chromosome segregation protein Spo0J
MNIIKIKIESLTAIEDFNVRADALSQAKIAEYTEIYEQLPPVSVFLVGGEYYLVDGWHRFRAAKNLELQEITVNIVGEGTEIDAQDFADASNLSHGIPLTPAQRRQVAVRFAKRHPDWSFREIARRMNCSHHTITAWLVKEASGQNCPGNTVNQEKASQTDRAGSIDIKAVSLKFTQWLNVSIRRAPIQTWSEQKKNEVKTQLKPIVELYQRL